MQYTEVTFTLKPVEPLRSLLVYAIGDEGPYDSFVETPDGMQAYVPTEQYSAEYLDSTVAAIRSQAPALASALCKYEAKPMPDKNWNEEWERNHTPILIESPCRIYVRAPFHEHRDDVDYELVIEPKMSFGTAHHPTTRMMLSFVAQEPLAGKRLLDMGTGTGVLAILAKMRGAAYVEAVDVDEWAYNNAVENSALAGVEIHPRLGDATTLSGCFDIVLANINKNILLRDMEAYVNVLGEHGVLVVSGFYEHDCADLTSRAAQFGFTLASTKTDEGWAAMKFER
ncbi:MAG: 50S ribosomal protein L11 methyltransferase [Bacteroidales bacterium]|nr:50S ribosomal protein L11 methyltransferase [Bacteroidales bacterium]